MLLSAAGMLRTPTACPGGVKLGAGHGSHLAPSRPRRAAQRTANLTHSSNHGSEHSGSQHTTNSPSPNSPSAHSPGSAPASTPAAAPEGITQLSTGGFQLRQHHLAMLALSAVVLTGMTLMNLQFTANMDGGTAVATVLRRVAKSEAFRQLVVIATAIFMLRYGLNNVLMALSKFSSKPVQWDKTKLYYILREVYQPLELLLFIAAICTASDAYVPSLIGVPKATVSHVVKSILSTSFILSFASVVFNLKSRFCKENAWQAEMKGDVTTQRRWEAYDKLGTFVIYVMSFVLGIQAMGLEVTSVLAIGGIGGLAIGLAGREICENLLNGFLIMSTNPFEVGDEITFFHNNKTVEGFVIDIGWYRTNVRSFEREVFVIPNAVFSKNIILNHSRRNREWRFYETISLRVQDVRKANAIVQDIRRIVRNDTRVINKLHRRVFLEKISRLDAQIYLSFYLEAANRDAFMAIKQDLLMSFVDCVERNGARLAQPRTVLDMEPEMADLMGKSDQVNSLMQGAFAMAQGMVAQQGAAMVSQQGMALQSYQLSLPSPTGPWDQPGMQSSPSQQQNQPSQQHQAGGNVITAEVASWKDSPPSKSGSSNGTGGPQKSSRGPGPGGGGGTGGNGVTPASQGTTQGSGNNQGNGTGGKSSEPSSSQPSGSPGKRAGSSSSQAAPASGWDATAAGHVPHWESVPSSGAPSSHTPAGSGTGAATGGGGSVSRGSKVGDVYTTSQSTLLVPLPATGLPVAYAGGGLAGNNVLPTTAAGGLVTKVVQGVTTGGTGAAGGASAGAEGAIATTTMAATTVASVAGTGQSTAQPQGNFLHSVLRKVAGIVFDSP